MTLQIYQGGVNLSTNKWLPRGENKGFQGFRGAKQRRMMQGKRNNATYTQPRFGGKPDGKTRQTQGKGHGRGGDLSLRTRIIMATDRQGVRDRQDNRL